MTDRDRNREKRIIDDSGVRREADTGKFVKGTRGGPGRPKFSRSVSRAIEQIGRAKDVHTILERRIDSALQGDTLAADVVLTAFFRRPRQESPSGPDGFELGAIESLEDALGAIARVTEASSQEGVDPEWSSAVLAGLRAWVDLHADIHLLAQMESDIAELRGSR